MADFEVDLQKNRCWWSSRLYQMLGFSEQDEVCSLDQYTSRIHREDRHKFESAFEESRLSRQPVEIEHRITLPGGASRHMRSTIKVNCDRTGRPSLLAGTLIDITEQKQAFDELTRSEAQFRNAMENAPIGMALVSLSGRFLRVNLALCEIVGYEEEDLLALDYQSITHPVDLQPDQELTKELLAGRMDAYRLEKRYINRDGHEVWVQLDRSLLRDTDGEPVHFISQIQSIGTRKSLEAQLRHAATHDPLTDLPNWGCFTAMLDRVIEEQRELTESKYAVLFIDLDLFKEVNDRYGHRTGDELIVAVAARIRKSLGETDTPARIGGDEFAVLIAHEGNEASVMARAERLRSALDEPFEIRDHVIRTSASIGVVFSRQEHMDAEQLLHHADRAMYRSKSAGKGRFIAVHGEPLPNTLVGLDEGSELNRAVENEEFVAFYQPIVSLEDGILAGFEALIRWRHPERGLIAPMDFIPRAELTGMILPIGEWILREACTQMQHWLRMAGPYKRLLRLMSVNVSRKQLLHPEALVQMEHIIQHAGLDPTCMLLEVTESTIISSLQDFKNGTSRLRKIGVRVCIDDFGTGFSNLESLMDNPVDMIKIDRTFIQETDRSRQGQEIIRSIVELAHRLHITVVVEGIETAAQLEFVRSLGCSYGQGFLLSPPVPAEVASALITNAHPWHHHWKA